MQQRVERKRAERRMWSNHKRYMKRRGVIRENIQKKRQAEIEAYLRQKYTMQPVAKAAPVKKRHGFIRRFFNRVTARITGRR